MKPRLLQAGFLFEGVDVVRKTIQGTYVFGVREAYEAVVLAQQMGATLGEVLLVTRETPMLLEPEGVCVLVDCMAGVVMARGNGKTQQTSAQQWTRFIEVSLNGSTKDDIEGEFGDANVVADALDGLMREGYRVGMTYNPTTRSFIASLTCKAEEKINSGCTLSAHAGDWWFALQVLCYKHFVIAKEDWVSLSPSGDAASFG